MNTTTTNYLAATDQTLIAQNQVLVCWSELNAKLAPIIGESLDFPSTIDLKLINSYKHLNNEIDLALTFLDAKEINLIKDLNENLIDSLLSVHSTLLGGDR